MLVGIKICSTGLQLAFDHDLYLYRVHHFSFSDGSFHLRVLIDTIIPRSPEHHGYPHRNSNQFPVLHHSIAIESYKRYREGLVHDWLGDFSRL
jgi:hypothetical protein